MEGRALPVFKFMLQKLEEISEKFYNLIINKQNKTIEYMQNTVSKLKDQKTEDDLYI